MKFNETLQLGGLSVFGARWKVFVMSCDVVSNDVSMVMLGDMGVSRWLIGLCLPP